MGITDNVYITKDEQKKFLKLVKQWEGTDKKTVKRNVRFYMGDLKPEEIADKLGIGINTIYQWTKEKGNRPSLYTALQLCELLGITIDRLMEN